MHNVKNAAENGAVNKWDTDGLENKHAFLPRYDCWSSHPQLWVTL